jgi:hypothetical protein
VGAFPLRRASLSARISIFTFIISIAYGNIIRDDK